MNLHTRRRLHRLPFVDIVLLRRLWTALAQQGSRGATEQEMGEGRGEVQGPEPGVSVWKGSGGAHNIKVAGVVASALDYLVQQPFR